jgi:hypothetical protein
MRSSSIPSRARSYQVADAVTYGIRTFVDALSAESPGQGFRVAVANLNHHLQRQEHQEERRYRALIREESIRRREQS